MTSSWLIYSLAPLRGSPLNGSWNFLPGRLRHGPTWRCCFWHVSLNMIQKFQCRLSLQPIRRKESLLKLSSREFRAWHSVVPVAWHNLYRLRRAVTIYKSPYSLKWEWRNVSLGSSWFYKVNRRKRSSPGSRLQKKTANRDPTSQCDVHQSHLLGREEEILRQWKLNHLQRPSQLEEEWLPARHVLITRITSRMSTWSLCSRYSKRVTGSNFGDQTP